MAEHDTDDRAAGPSEQDPRRGPTPPRAAAGATGNGDGSADTGLHAPTLEIGGPVESSWREFVLTRVAEQHTMLDWLLAHGASPEPEAQALKAGVVQHLDAARDTAIDTGTFTKRTRAALSGSSIERTSGQLDAVECSLLRLGGEGFRRGQMPSLLAHVRRHLEPSDPRRRAVEQLAARKNGDPWEDWEGERVLAAVHAASSKARREVRQVRSFRNTLYATALVLTIAALAMAVVGWRSPASIPLCFNPGETVVCPTSETTVTTLPSATHAARVERAMRTAPRPGDVALVELLGLMAAALAAAVALHNIRGTSTPYSLPIALAILKLPTGALTAVIALVLMRGEFIPGFTALDTSGQILAWAVVFGYAQQLFTHLVDRQAHTVLDNVRSGGTAPAAGTEAALAADTPAP